MNLFNIRRIIKDCVIILALTALGLVVTLGLVDVVAYSLFGIRPPGHGAEKFFQYHSVAGRIQKPHARGYWHRYRDGSKYWVEINAHGFADRPREFAKERPRIALVGDSTAQFWEAPPAARGHVVLEQQLQEEWEVLNFGVRGFGLDQSRLLYRELGARFMPDIVVLNVCINDVWDHATVEGKPYYVIDPDSPGGIQLRGIPVPDRADSKLQNGLHWFLWNHSYTLRRFRLVRHPELKAFYPLEDHFELRPFKRKYNQRDKELLELTFRIIASFAQDLEDQGVRLLLVEMPYRPVLTSTERRQIIRQYGDGFDFDRWSTTLKEFSQREGVALVSLPDAIKARKLNAAQLFHPEDVLHINSEGIRLYADVVVESLESRGWLGRPSQ